MYLEYLPMYRRNCFKLFICFTHPILQNKCSNSAWDKSSTYLNFNVKTLACLWVHTQLIPLALRALGMDFRCGLNPSSVSSPH